MQLGIVITDEGYMHQAIGLLDAAHARGWHTLCFLTDTGVNLLAHDGCVERAKSKPNMVALCEHSAEKHAADLYDLQAHADYVIVGGQYQNAELVQKCDRVLVL
ncbi:MAG: hypothetical protein MUE59_15400 [Thiobacillaceae bacterium]|jgi:hypothetical protein|nr:hypothetical protein [Thiobacillaceae bacterium]